MPQGMKAIPRGCLYPVASAATGLLQRDTASAALTSRQSQCDLGYGWLPLTCWDSQCSAFRQHLQSRYKRFEVSNSTCKAALALPELQQNRCHVL